MTLLALALVGAGSQVPPPDASQAVERAAVTTPSPTATATPAAAESASAASRSAPVRRAKPAPKRKRSPDQLAAGLRADGTAYRVPAKGNGRFTVARQSRKSSARSGRLIRFDVRVEHGLAVDPDQAALLIARVLDDKRSWRRLQRVRFELVPRGARADLHAYVATPRTTDRLCAPLRTRGEVSCQIGNRVVLNAKRWVGGARSYGRDVKGYRSYLINHEFGHTLGRRHVRCPGRGRPAPVMLQQTKGLGGCRANPWPSRTRG